METKAINWQTAIVGVCTVVLTLMGTTAQIHPIEDNQKEIVGKLLELSEANKALNKLILESVTDSHNLNIEMLKVVKERRELFDEMKAKLAAIESKIK